MQHSPLQLSKVPWSQTEVASEEGTDNLVRKGQRTLKKTKILFKMVHIMQKIQELLETTDSNVTLGSKFNPLNKEAESGAGIQH